MNPISWPTQRPSTAIASMASIALAASIAACGVVPLTPEGFRQWTVIVDNQSNGPAIIVVGVDVNFGDPGWRAVGTAVPSTVPPKTRALVVLTVPPPGNWAVFVNPGPKRGPLLIPGDVPSDFSGELPGTILVRINGEPGFESPRVLPPGWCAGGSHLGCG